MAQKSILDQLFSLYSNHQGIFKQGWGNTDALEHLLKLDPAKLNQMLNQRRLKKITPKWEQPRISQGYQSQEATFQSPFTFTWKQKNQVHHETLPQESQMVRIQMLSPLDATKDTPLIVIFAATGDEGFAQRNRFLARPLARQGIASIMIENPFYGSRRLANQRSNAFQRVSDFMQISRAVQDEGLALLNWLQQNSYCHLGVAGISMGAYMAMAVAAQSRLPLAIAACLPTHSASAPYTRGTYRRACDWQGLHKDLKPKHEPVKVMAALFDLAEISQLPLPVSVKSAVLVGARKDAYIPLRSTLRVHQYWQGSELRWLSSGHIGSILFHNKSFVKAIQDSVDRTFTL